MTVIDFHMRKAQAAVALDDAPEVDRFQGSDLELAFEVHRIIINALRMEELRDKLNYLDSVVSFAMAHRFGPHLADWAELQFERVYGARPRVFIDQVASYLA